MFRLSVRRTRARGVREILALALSAALAFSGLVLDSAPAEASELAPVTKMCRSTDGTGNSYQTSTTSNGYYQSEGLRITPIFSKKMYVDGSRNFDASYIGYRITNTGTSSRSNLAVELTGFTGGVVSPATDADRSRRIGTLAANATANVYFLLKATSATTVNQRHDFRVFTDDGVTKTQQVACYTELLGVKRSLAASANKVTSIAVDGAAQLGQTLTITVKGAPGKVGAGESAGDGSIMMLSPASYSAWPTKALRLENVQIILNAVPTNVANNSSAACFVGTNDGFGADTANMSYASGTKKLTVNNRLILRNFGNCATTTKQTYEAIYTFRVIGSSATNPAIFPLASISSGTQIKYTGSLPASTTTVPLTSTTYPLNVKKTFVSSATVLAGTVDVTYRITASSSISTNFEEFRDEPDPGATFVSASFTDSSAGGTRTPAQVNVGTIGEPIWRFKASSSNAATNFTVTSSTSAVLTYVARYPITDTNTSYRNLAYVVQNDVKIGNSGLTTGIDATVGSDGNVTAAEVTEKIPQKITFDPTPTLGQNSTMTITAYSDSTLPVSFASAPEDRCGIKEQNGVWTLFALSEGDCLVTATQGGNETFEAAPDVTRTIKILKGQIITGNAGFFSGNTASVEVSATSKLPVTLTALDTDICTLTVGTAYNASTGITVYTATKGPLVQPTDGGTCLMVASQDGVPIEEESVQIWGPAPDKDLGIGFGAAQYLRFLSSNPTEPSGGFLATTASFTVTFTSVDTDGGSNRTGLPVAVASLTSDVCTVRVVVVADEIDSGYDEISKDTTVSVDRVNSGICTLEASQNGDNDTGDATSFAPAANITKSFNLKSAGNLTQYVAFDPIATLTYGDPSFFAFASSSSSSSSLVDTTLLVGIRSTTESVCQVGASSRDGSKSKAEIFIVAAGTCSLAGLQSGDDTYQLETATTSFEILKKPLSVVGLSGVSREYDGTTESSFSGTAALSGVVPGDSSEQVRVVGPGSIAQFSSAAVGSEPLALDDFRLEGSKSSSSYTISQPTVTGTITPRLITIKFNDITVGQTPEYNCGTSSVSVSIGLIVETEELSSIVCDNLPNFGSGYSNGSTSVTPGEAVIASKSDGLPTTSNYDVTYVAGDFTVSSLTIPVLEAPELEVVYGTLTVQTEGADSDSGPSAKKVRAKNGASFVEGSVSQKVNGQSITANLGAGQYVVDVEFTPSDPGFAKVTGTRAIKVLQRKLIVNNIAITSKQYDGNRSATITGSPQLAADNDDPIQGLDVVPGDDITLTDPSAAEFADANIGSHSVAIHGLSLTGTDVGNYLLRVPTFTANITKRNLKLAPVKSSYSKLVDESDPEFDWKLTDGTSFASGENEDTLGGVTVSRQSGDAASLTPYTVSVSVGNAIGKDNYEVTTEVASLYVASITITISETEGELTSNDVECACAGLEPGSEVTLTMFSTPTVIATTTVDEDGECPFLNGTLPSDETGTHTLELSSSFPNGDPALLSKSIRFPTLDAPIDDDLEGSSGPGGSESDLYLSTTGASGFTGLMGLSSLFLGAGAIATAISRWPRRKRINKSKANQARYVGLLDHREVSFQFAAVLYYLGLSATPRQNLRTKPAALSKVDFSRQWKRFVSAIINILRP